MLENENLYFLEGEGEMRELYRKKNWQKTAVGAPNTWPQSLRTTLDNLLNSLFPMFLFWGEENVCFYNDAYRPSLGTNGKHPLILGKSAREAWPEIWDEIGPMISQVMGNGGPIWRENQLIPIFRNGQIEDVYWTFCYSPVREGSGNPVGVLVVCMETTAAVKVNEMLLESEKRFRAMAEGTSLMISVCDENGNIIYFNEAWSKFTGKKKGSSSRLQWYDLFHADEKEKAISEFNENLKKKNIWETEYRMREVTGEYRWLSLYMSPRFRPDGAFSGYVSSAIDTHERKTLEQDAVKFRFMADNASDPFVLMRADGTFEYLNQAALNKWEYSQEEIKFLKVPDVDPKHDQKDFEELFKMAMNSDVPVFETVHKTKSGREFPVEAKVSGFNFNGRRHMLAIARDISERKKAEENLRESELRFRKIADQAPMWIWMTDVNVNVEYANRNLLDYLGIEQAADFTGQVWESMVHPDDIDIVYEGFKNAVDKGAVFSLEYRVKRASTGEFEWFTLKGVPRFDEDILTGFIGTGMNVHKQKTFSEALKNEVDMRTKELADVIAKLEKTNKELQSFAYISSHDLQEPLRKIQTFCSILVATEFDRLSEKGKYKFQKMQSAAKRMQTLINDLLAYSLLDVGDRIFKTMDLAQIVNEIEIDLVEELGLEKGKITILESCKVEVVHFQFRQLLYNLLSNSLKYSKPDIPPVIEIKGDLVKSVNIDDTRVLPDKIYSRIKVTDNGIGFDNGFSEKIFEVFQRLHDKQKYRGTGVGLAIVKKIAENHNGFVTARGEIDKGAVFEVYIPRHT